MSRWACAFGGGRNNDPRRVPCARRDPPLRYRVNLARIQCGGIAVARRVHVAYAQGPRGFTESATGNALRPGCRLVRSDLRAVARTLHVPSPYGTTGIRLTNGSDCGGSDCVNYVGYSYWRNINNHAGSDTMLIFLGLNRNRGGGPRCSATTRIRARRAIWARCFLGTVRFPGPRASLVFQREPGTALYINDTNQLLSATSIRRRWKPSSTCASTSGPTSTSSRSTRAARQCTRAASGCQLAHDERALRMQEDRVARPSLPPRVITTSARSTRVAAGSSSSRKRRWPRRRRQPHHRLAVGRRTGVSRPRWRSGSFRSWIRVSRSRGQHVFTPGAARVWQLGQDLRGAGQGTVVYNLTDWMRLQASVTSRTKTRKRACRSLSRWPVPAARSVRIFRVSTRSSASGSMDPGRFSSLRPT